MVVRLTARSRVYCWCMARTNIDIDENLCWRVMERYQSRAACLKGRAREALASEVGEVIDALRDLGVLNID